MAKKFNLAALVPEMEAVSNSDTPRITMIPIDELRPNGGNFYDTSNFEDLADSIELNGLLEPLCVFRRGQGTGHYVIFSGHRRYKALRLLYEKSGFEKWTEVPCIVYPDPHDANREMVMLIHANSTGRILSNWEKAEQALRLKKALIAMRESGAELPGRIRDLVAEEMQMSSSKLARLEAIGNNLKFSGFADAWKAGKLGESVAYEISKLSMDKQMDVWDGMIDEGLTTRTLSIKDVERLAADDAGAAHVSRAVFNSDTPTVIGTDMAESGSDRTAMAIYHRCLVDEPEEGQLVLLLDPGCPAMPNIVRYRDGQFHDDIAHYGVQEVKSSMWWLPLPPFPWEQRDEQ